MDPPSVELGAGTKFGGGETKETAATVSAAAAALVAKPSSARTIERVRARRSETTSATTAERDAAILLAGPQQPRTQRVGLKIPRTFCVIDLSL